MATKIREKVGAKSKASSLERLEHEVALYEKQAGERREVVEQLEDDLDGALLAVREGGDDARVEVLRRELREARDQASDVERLVRKLREQLSRERSNRDAARYAERLAEARDAADSMTAALQQLEAGCDLVVAAMRNFQGARERFFAVCPEDRRPQAVPAVWTRLDVYAASYIGARCPMFRAEAMRRGVSLEQLARRNEAMELHADALAQIFPTDPPAKAA